MGLHLTLALMGLTLTLALMAEFIGSSENDNNSINLNDFN